ncbi:MAG: serine/threonine protein kinase [Acidobacteria bacterium]|nr:MAG: serine/threonine protein kinase [Acidobacteriota bacterium]
MSKIIITDKVGRYEVRGLVGRGAMGVVYSAIDPNLGRSVAIKTMSISDSPHETELRKRFLQEAQAAGQLQHPNIITVHELFEEGDTAFLVMELLEGASLSALLKQKKAFSLAEKISIIDQIAAGLSEAHAHRIVHRDMKPSNVFVLRSGVVKVLDFGVAKVGDGELTKAGTVFGTVEYMAPEQVRGQSVTQQADIFSLGVVSYELLSGRNPFRADTLAASVFKIMSDNPSKLSDDATVPVEIEAVIFRALAKPMADRFGSLSELRAELQQAAEKLGVTPKPPVLADEDVEITKERRESVAVSVAPRVSQWSNVAAQADLLEQTFQLGVQAYGKGEYEDCVSKMSQVLDEVPVHAMSLHYLASSEERLRRQRLSNNARKKASALLTAMRDAHRQGESDLVTEKANAFLALDPESMEARWYRRNAEARKRAATVGGARAADRSQMGSPGGRPQGSFGYTPSLGGTTSSPQTPPVFATTPSTLASSSKGMWVLAGVAILFMGLIVMWLGSIGSPGPAVSASHGPDPKVRVSPFDGMDDSQAVRLQLQQQEPEPAAPRAAFSVRYVIPTTIEVGPPTTLGLFGEGFPDDAKVSITAEGVFVLSTNVRSPEHIEIQIQADEAHEKLDIVVEDAAGARVAIALTVHQR